MGAQFAGKVALVTGAGSGIGRASAIAFAGQGAKVIVSDISEKGGMQTVQAIMASGGEAFFVQTDVARPSDVKSLIKATIDKYGRLDCAHNNAGITGNSTKVADCSLEEWDMVMNVNLRGTFLCLRYEIPQMIKQGSGAIVNMSSTMGVVAHGNTAAYASSKHGVIGLTRSAALAYVKDNIRINALCPGNTETPIFDHLKQNMPAVYEGLFSATPIGRFAQPNEIANAVLWLCSDAASYCTGHAMVVDGGYTIQ